jgi:SAM-dependent methyltransferase
MTSLDDAEVNIFDANRAAWDQAVEDDNPYSRAVTSKLVAAAREGTWEIFLSDTRPVPAAWFPELRGARVLCLASGGGQQAPILAGAGAQVWVLDASPRQLAQDRFVAERDDLELTTLEGDMADLSAFDSASLDLIVNPVSTLFVPELDPIWAECGRTLKPGGVLMTGFLNPDEFVFDPDALDNEGRFVVRYPLPYAELATLDKVQIAERRRNRQMFHFSHTMEAQLGGILRAGFVVTDFFEDHRPDSDQNPIRDFMPSYFVVRAEHR